MEAVAKHDFTANANDELSFRRNQILKVCDFAPIQTLFAIAFAAASPSGATPVVGRCAPLRILVSESDRTLRGVQ